MTRCSGRLLCSSATSSILKSALVPRQRGSAGRAAEPYRQPNGVRPLITLDLNRAPGGLDVPADKSQVRHDGCRRGPQQQHRASRQWCEIARLLVHLHQSQPRAVRQEAGERA